MAKPENLELWPRLPRENQYKHTLGILPEIEKSFVEPEEMRRLAFSEMDRLTSIPNLTFANPETDEEDFFIFLPYSTTLRGWVYENEQIAEMTRVFKMERLSGIKSLSLLSQVEHLLDQAGTETKVHFIGFDQDRFLHSLVVSRFMEAVLRRLNFPEDQIKLGVAAAMLHDIATPAFGDSTKLVDQPNLHEEDWWHDMVDEEGWKYLEGIGATKEQIDDIIHNRGVLGRLLDISDRISYTLIDAYHAWGFGTKDKINAPFYDEAKNLIAEDENLGDIWQEIEFDEKSQDFYFTNPRRLGRILLLRALMHRVLYIHPWSQSRDLRAARMIKPFYSPDNSQTDKLTPRKLRRMADRDLLFFLIKQYGGEEKDVFHFIDWYPEYYEIFDTREEADSRAQEVLEDPIYTLFAVKSGPGFDPATDYRVIVGEDGLFTSKRLVPYRRFHQKRASYIEEIAKKMKKHYVYYFTKGNTDELTMSLADEKD